MFHRYVANSKLVHIDIDRAMFLMDKTLIPACLRYINDANCREFHENVEDIRAMHFFDHYCYLHEKKYGEQFSVDLMTEPL